MGKLGNKLKTNYNLSKWLIFVIFVLTSIFSEWNMLSSVVKYMNYISPELEPYWLYAAISGVISGIISLVFIYFLVKGLMFFGRFYNMPVMEVFLLLVIALSGANVLHGLLELTYLITPLIIPWGKYLFGFVSGLPAVLWFYSQLRKRYLNTHTAGVVFLWIMLTFMLINAMSVFGGGMSL